MQRVERGFNKRLQDFQLENQLVELLRVWLSQGNLVTEEDQRLKGFTQLLELKWNKYSHSNCFGRRHRNEPGP